MTKQDAISIITKCARQYKEELVDNSLLIIDVSGRCFEFYFYDRNFMHLTGVVSDLAAVDFYNKCINRTLSLSDFEIAQNGMTELKLMILPNLMKRNLSANMIGEYSGNRPSLKTKRVVGKVTGYVGFAVDKNTNRYVPNTVINADIRNDSNDYKSVLCVYRKSIEANRYEELTFLKRGCSIDDVSLPSKYQYLQLQQ